MKTQPLGPFLGINNRLPDFALHVETRYTKGDYLPDAVNVYLDNAGRFKRRELLTNIVPMTGAHSLSTDGAYLVRDSVLYAITLPSYTETLFKVLASNAAMSWCAAGDDLYYSNGTDSGRISAGVWYPLGMVSPASPTLSVIGGNLNPGWYQVGVSYSNSVTGEEGCISASSNLELTSLGGLRVTLPAASPGATHVNVYLSMTNGSIPMWLAQVPVGTAIYDAISLATGRESNGHFEEPLPAGNLFTSNGRLCSFSGKRVYIGSPWRFGYYTPVDASGAAGYIDFAEDVTVAIENQGGTYIVADKTRWFPGGDLANVESMINDVLPYGAVKGTAFSSPTKPQVGWFGKNGLVIGSITGEVSALTEDALDVTLPASGVSQVFEDEATRRVVSCGYCVNLENKGASRYEDWEINSAAGSYALKSDGIYQITTGGEVDWSISLGRQNFGTEVFKHLPAVYVGVACEDPITLQVKTPEEVDYSYEARSGGVELQQQRFDPGKGLKANWFDLTLSGTLQFTMASISFAATPTTRRI